MTKTYSCGKYRSVGKFEYCADFTQASSPIMVRFDAHDDWQPVPFQVADCHHDRKEVERMIAQYFR